LLGALPSPATSATTAALAAAAAATVGVGASGSRRPPIIGFPRLPTPLAALVVALDIPAALAPAVPVALATAAHVLAAPLVAVAIAVSHAPRQGGIERQRMLPPPPPSTSPSPSPPPPPSPSPPSPSPSPPPPSPSRCRHWFPRSATMHEQRELPPLLPASADYAERYRGGYRAWMCSHRVLDASSLLVVDALSLLVLDTSSLLFLRVCWDMCSIGVGDEMRSKGHRS
ncbi:hypothetical protein K525DRAFT_273644, partial [Schizophyllum commune Loenen D]